MMTMKMQQTKLKKKVMLWSAIPCTGGCPFVSVNIHKGKATEEKIANHWKLFRKLWNVFMKISDQVILQGGLVAVEWPNKCRYWHERAVRNYVARHGLHTAHVHACEYGMTAISDPTKYLHKIWHVKTN